MAKINDREGDWFAVPLRKGGYAVGLIAHANPDGVLLGYFSSVPVARRSRR